MTPNAVQVLAWRRVEEAFSLEYGSRRRLFTLPRTNVFPCNTIPRNCTFPVPGSQFRVREPGTWNPELGTSRPELTDPRTAQYDRRFRHNCGSRNCTRYERA